MSLKQLKYKIVTLLFLSFLLIGLVSTGNASDRIRVAFFPGGAENGPFAKIIYNGAKAAAKDLDVHIDYYWSDWKNDQMLMQFNQAINTKPDGIAIMGHPGDKPYQRLITKSVNMGIIVTSQNVPLPENEKRYKHTGFGYVGQDLFQSGESLAEAAIKKAHVEKGDRVAVWGFLKIEGRGERTKGALYPLKKKELIIDYLEVTDESNKEASKMIDEVKGYLRSHPDVKIIIFDHGALTAMSETYLKAAGKKPGEIFVAGFDLSPASVKAIESGFLGVILDQQPFLQGYIPVLQIYLTKKYGFAGMHIDTGAALIDKTNISAIKHLAVKGLR